MKTYEFTGTLKVREKSFHVNLKTSIEPQNYLYIGIDRQPGLSQLTIFIKPFTPQMLEKYGYKLEDGVDYQFSGNHIGFISCGGGGPEGVWDNWHINKVCMEFRYFRDGVSLTFRGDTERGCSTWLGSLDQETIGKHEPLNFSINFLVPVEKLVEFLNPEETKISQSEKNIKFVEQLKKSELPNYG
jgi:hypothetical protein